MEKVRGVSPWRETYTSGSDSYPSASGQPTANAMRANGLRRRRCKAGRKDTSGTWLSPGDTVSPSAQARQSAGVCRPGAQARHWLMLKVITMCLFPALRATFGVGVARSGLRDSHSPSGAHYPGAGDR